MFEADFRLALKEKIDVLSASERVEALLGYKPKEFLLSTISLEGLVHPHDAAVVRQLFSPSSKGESGEVKVRVRHADGRIRCLSWVYERENKAQGFRTGRLWNGVFFAVVFEAIAGRCSEDRSKFCA